MRKIIIATIILCSMFLTGCGSADVYDKLYLKTLYITENSDCSARMEFFGDNSQDITAHGSSFRRFVRMHGLVAERTYSWDIVR